MRTAPAVRELHRLYRDRGLVVVGVHSPEFDHERDLDAVRRAIARLEIDYPVAIDNDFAIWRAFGNRYWPALYLVGPDGTVLARHVGELHRGTDDWDEVVSEVERALGAAR